MWLATLEAGKVALHVRPKIERNQLEAADALHAYFFGVALSLRGVAGQAPATDSAARCRLQLQAWAQSPLRPLSARAGSCASARLWRVQCSGGAYGCAHPWQGVPEKRQKAQSYPRDISREKYLR
jgi:hypothetical protein